MKLFLISFVLQIIFAVARTANVSYIARKNTTGAVLSGTFVSFLWVVTTKFGIDAYNEGWLGMSGYMLGAAIGVYLGMLKSKKD